MQVPVGFKEVDQEQSVLIPTAVNDYISVKHPVRMFKIIIQCLDLSKIYEKYKPGYGQNAYDPRMMIGILFYALYVNVESSREIQAHLETDLAFKFIAGNQQPNYRTIARFRKVFFEDMEDLFNQIVKLCNEYGLVNMKHLSIDGTKIKANASYRENIEEKKIEAKIRNLLRKACQRDMSDDEIFGDSATVEIPPEVANDPKLLEKIKGHINNLNLLREHAKEKMNKTDPDANTMKNQSLTLPSYNVQASIDDFSNVMVALDVTQEETDHNQLVNMVEKSINNTGITPGIVCADAGYFTYENIEWCEENGINALIPDNMYFIETYGRVKRYPKSKFRYDPDSDTYICPAGRTLYFRHTQKDKKGNKLRIYRGNCDSCPLSLDCKKGKHRSISRHPKESLKETTRTKLNSKLGKDEYNKRLTNAEGAFGVIKHNRKWKQSLYRGFEMVKGDAFLHGTIYNIGKMIDLCPEKIMPKCLQNNIVGPKCPQNSVQQKLICGKSSLDGNHERNILSNFFQGDVLDQDSHISVRIVNIFKKYIPCEIKCLFETACHATA